VIKAPKIVEPQKNDYPKVQVNELFMLDSVTQAIYDNLKLPSKQYWNVKEIRDMI
jgi:hypothetical protein